MGLLSSIKSPKKSLFETNSFRNWLFQNGFTTWNTFALTGKEFGDNDKSERWKRIPKSNKHG